MEKKYFSFGSGLCAKADGRLDNNTIKDIWSGFCYGAAFIALTEGEENCFQAGDAALPELKEGLEYAVSVTETGLAVRGRDYAGLARGLMVLMMRIEAVSLEEGKESFRIAECSLESRYTIENRMIHFCVFPETTPVFIKKCLRLAGVMQYTHVVLEFWGMLRYDCLKELAWPMAYDKAQARALVKEIEDMGMKAIPMMNHLGHAAACRVSGGKHVVLDQNPRLAMLFSQDGWSWNIESEQAHELLKKVRAELYEIFPGCEYFHLGCDEVYSYEKGDEDQRKMREFLRGLIEEVKAEGKKPIIWGDMLLNAEAVGVESRRKLPRPDRPYFCGCDTPENAEKMIAAIPKDTIIADWHYDVLEAPIETSVYLKNKGFPVLGAPWFKNPNCQAHVDTIVDNSLFGLMVTTWHTLAEKMPHIVTDALMFGAYQSPWSGEAPSKIRTETATLLRKLCFVEGDYKEAGWTDSQIFLQANPMV